MYHCWMMTAFIKANPDSQLGGVIRTFPEDFQVDEIPLFEPSGQGEHVFLHIKKTGENTDWVAGQLAKIAGVTRRDVSYAGLKDRHAVTTQWFSVWLPGKQAPDWQGALPNTVVVLAESRHDRKLKRGSLKGNHFKLLIRDFKGDEAELAASVERIKGQGVPNYFAGQRFGQDGFNIRKAEQWFEQGFKIKDRQKRSLYLSAARSWIFNHVLSERVKDKSWDQASAGDVFMLGNSNACFKALPDDEIIQRVRRGEIHPSGPLWGQGDLVSDGVVAGLETAIARQFERLSGGLEKHGLKQQRRSLRLMVDNMNYTLSPAGCFKLSFDLASGCYATSVLAELGQFASV